jgi:hypothetical protein
MEPSSGFHVLVRTGDASPEVESALRDLGSPARAGLHRYFYVSRANQTVVMTLAPDAPLAVRLRKVAGWSEPGAYDS